MPKNQPKLETLSDAVQDAQAQKEADAQAEEEIALAEAQAIKDPQDAEAQAIKDAQDAEAQAIKDAEEMNIRPFVGLSETIPGGRYLVNGIFVNANGEPLAE